MGDVGPSQIGLLLQSAFIVEYETATRVVPSNDIEQALDLTPPLPASLGILARWTAEPTRHIFLPATTFVPNAKGYPVLTKATQAFLRDIVKVGFCRL